MNLDAFFKHCFFNESVCFFASGILEDGSVNFFHLNFEAFLKQNGFFQWECYFFWLQAFSVAFFHLNF